jgi:signal transduction histidine kinase
VLVVDDEEGVRFVFSQVLSEAGCDGLSVPSSEEAIVAFGVCSFDAVITDIVLPGMDGLSLLRWLRQFDPGVPVIVISGLGSRETAMAALQDGASDYFTKPAELREIRESLARLTTHARGTVRTPVIAADAECVPVDGLQDRIAEDTTAAFIHKLVGECGALSSLAQELRSLLGEVPGGVGERLLVCVGKLGAAADSTQYLLQRFRNAVGRHPGVLRPIDLARVLTDVRDHLAPRFPGRTVLDLGPGRVFVSGDYELLWHLFENLVRNGLEAVSERSDGQVTVAFSVDAAARTVSAVVRDNGPGIAPTALSRIFGLSYSTKRKGMGVGLYLVRRAVHVHRGHLHVGSVQGTGTEFSVSLPLAPDGAG